MVYNAGSRSPARLVCRPASQAAAALVEVDTVSCHSRSMVVDGAGGADAAAPASRLRAAHDADIAAASAPLCATAWRSALRAAVAGSPASDHHADTWESIEAGAGAVTVVVEVVTGVAAGRLAPWDSATG